MKFLNKIVIGTCLIIAVCFSVGGIVMAQRNFSVAYKKDIENYTKQCNGIPKYYKKTAE